MNSPGFIASSRDVPLRRPIGTPSGRVVEPPQMPAHLVAFAVFFISLLCDAYWLSAIGMGASAYFFVRLVLATGHDLPIESLILVLASLQWIVGPMCAYWGLSNHYKFYMYVPEPEYMALAVPSVIMLALGLYGLRYGRRVAFLQDCAEVTGEIVARSRKLPIYLVGVGLVFSYLAGRVPAALEFPVYIFSNIKYIGLIYLIFSDWLTDKKLPLLIAFYLTFMSSLHSAMFHDLLLWSAFVGMYAAYVSKPSLKKKLGLVLLAMIFVAVLQVAKDQYRMLLMKEGRSDYVSKFVTAVDNELLEDRIFADDNVERLVVRFNQGWIISRIMQNVPSVVPHADGETIITAVKASILPRALYPDKPIAGGRANYQKYTGFELQASTSMGISLLGEAYINFGLEGAWAFMLVFGVLTALTIRGFFHLAWKYPTIWLWLPLILLHFVKAETELLVQLNFLVKSALLVLVFLWLNRTFLKWKL